MFLPHKNKPKKHFSESDIKLFAPESSLLGPAGVRVTVVLDHPEEALLLVRVLGEAVEEESAHPDGSLGHIIDHLKSTSSSSSSSSTSSSLS